MSRIGKKPVVIPDGVEVKLEANLIRVKNGSKVLEQEIHPNVQVKVENNEILVTRSAEDKKSRALHGLMRSLIYNMVVGVKDGFSKTLDVNGIGYRAQKQGNTLVLNVGLSHPVEIAQPDGIEIDVPAPNKIVVKGADKQLVGETAAKIRAVRLPDAYKGKGIKYDYEVLRLKEGKTGAK